VTNRTRHRLAACAAAFVLLLAVGWIGWRTLRGGGTGSAAAREAQEALSAKFVGAASCAACHAQEAAAWTGSQHSLAMQVASEESVRGDFNGTGFTYAGITSTFFRRDGKFLVRTDAADGALQEFEVRYTFGVDPLQQYLIELPGGHIQPLSIAWDTRSRETGGQRWFHLYPGEGVTHTDELHWTGRAQNWNFMCADCHSTNVVKGYDARTDEFRTTWSEINVSCEACHGPGSRHVEWADTPRWLRGLRRGNGLTAQLTERQGVRWTIDSVSGNARRSTPRQSTTEIQVCAQCHSRRSQIAGGYRAGTPLLDSYLPELLMPGLYYADGQQRDEVYKHGSFLQSRMFHAGVTCSDCHEPHSQKLRAPGNALCAQCHQAAKYAARTHTFHETGSTGAQCVSCHMPTTNYMQIDARRDHSIRVPRPDQSVTLGVPNACTQCHTDRSAAWAAERVRGRYGHDPRGFQSFAEAFAADERDAADAAPRLARIAGDSAQPAVVRASALARLAGHPGQDAMVTARGGLADPDPQVRRAALLVLENLAPQERVDLAAPLLEDRSRAVRTQAAWLLAPTAAALSLSPSAAAFAGAVEEFIVSQRYNADRPESRVTLGTFFAQLGRPAEAVAEYRAALRLAPRDRAAYVNLADLYRGLGREGEAERVLREGLAVVPDAAVLHHALGLSLARSGRTSEAVEELARAAALAPDDARIAYTYAVALNSSGHATEAVRVLEQARAHHPNERDLLFALATISRDAGKLAAAQQYADLLVQSHPEDAEARALVQSLGGAGEL
jgi:predicted CXXCH cytochrome family protein